jgi:hypothetical protein
VGLLLSPFIVMQYGWRALFLIFGVVGAPLLAFWLAVTPGKPHAAAAGGGAGTGGSGADAGRAGSGREASTSGGSSGGGSVNVLTLMRHHATWAIIVVNFINHWGYFIYLNWMPSYFKVGPPGGARRRGGGRGAQLQVVPEWQAPPSPPLAPSRRPSANQHTPARPPPHTACQPAAAAAAVAAGPGL